MPSLSARIANLIARVTVKRVLNAPKMDLHAVRRAMAGRAGLPNAFPAGVRVEKSVAPELPGEWITPAVMNSAGVILFMHGGGYLAGSPKTHRAFTTWLAHRAGMRVFSLDYRLAPEHPFPAGLDGAVRAVHALVAAGTPMSQMVFCGDSAGGGLVLATMLRLRDEGAVLPAGAALLCPLTDCTGDSKSLTTNADAEPLLGLRHRDAAMQAYAGQTPLSHPYISPLLADLRGLPPMLVEASRIEVLWDDAARFVEKAKAAGVDITFAPHDGLAHDWQLMVPFTSEARASVRRIAGFLMQHVA
jgi:monoterpene epsilon-lactone hydrolase